MRSKRIIVFRFSPALLLLGCMMFAGTVSPALAQEMYRPPDPPFAKTDRPPEALQLMEPTDIPEASTINYQFEGMKQTGAIRPPDPHGAAGTSGIIQTVNLRIAYYPKNGTGVAIWGPVNLSTFFGISGSGTSDPRVVFDATTARFYVIMQENVSSTGFLNVAVSKTSNPTGSTTASWWFYRINITQTVGTTKYGCDYPGLGVDGQALYVTYNMYSFVGGVLTSFNDCQVVIFNKTSINGGALGTVKKVFTPAGSSNGFTLQPASVIGGTPPANTAYLGETKISSTTQVRVWKLTNPLTTPVLTSTTITVPNNGGFISSAPQCSPGPTVPTLSSRTQGNACWYNNQLWFCHTAGGSSGKAIVYYYKVNTSTMTLTQSGGINGGTGVSTYQPSIGVSSNGSVALVYTQSSSSQCPRIVYASRSPTATTFDTPVNVKISPSYSNSDRWGDYASVTRDPSFTDRFCLTHEWAKTNALHNWSTWWVNIRAFAPPLGPALTDAAKASESEPSSPVAAEAEPLPTAFSLDQNYPNPFNPITAISFKLPVESHVVLKIYDTVGQEVATLVDEVVSAGYKQVAFDATRLSSGVYYYRLQAKDLSGANNFTDVKKLTMMK